ncbi:MAG: sigma-70 family RNA polymerase sigma factor [Melioribacter sp.]|uniref:RNA polymerase sigma factor n=1 Tax=Rosettibacter primus TaxID=3111523 RepID=UPI00247BFC89|nr:sigma-70 family RNA polymerase sigma factor [Melioribacter sp.]
MNSFKELTDLELMREIANFESRALEELYDRYSPLLYTLIKKITPDEETAEKVLVDVFVIVWRKTFRFNFNNGNVYSWLITLARNKAVDTLRRSRNSLSTSQIYDDEYEDYFIIPTFPDDMDSLDLNTAMSLVPKVERALSKLTDTQKYVLHLAYYEGYTIDEIADKLNVPIETVRSKVMNALHNFRDNLTKE